MYVLSTTDMFVTTNDNQTNQVGLKTALLANVTSFNLKATQKGRNWKFTVIAKYLAKSWQQSMMTVNQKKRKEIVEVFDNIFAHIIKVNSKKNTKKGNPQIFSNMATLKDKTEPASFKTHLWEAAFEHLLQVVYLDVLETCFRVY